MPDSRPSCDEVTMPCRAMPSRGLVGRAHVPGDKSISHRAVLTGSLCVGETRIRGLLEADDVMATVGACRQMGAWIATDGDGNWTVSGVGVGGFLEPEDILDCGNSGTGVRLLMGALATSQVSAILTGDASLRSRPMDRVVDPLAEFGARFRGRLHGRLPLTMTGAPLPIPVTYALPVPSAQVKSAILYAGLNCRGRTTVIEDAPTRDHTERMLAAFGADLSVEMDGAERQIHVRGHVEMVPQSLTVPGDISSAAFPLAAGLMTEDADIVLPGIGVNPTRTGLLTTLDEMGAGIVIENERQAGGEPVADLRVRSQDLVGVDVPPERSPTMIDEYPILAAVAACAEGDTVMRGIAELRVKECDRIAAMVEGLERCGVRITEHEDGMTVHGRGAGSVSGGAVCRTFHDHRIAMSFLCLGLAAKAPIGVDDARPIRTSFPGFIGLMESLGAEFVQAGHAEGGVTICA